MTLATTANAQTSTWEGNTDGDWNEASNWDTAPSPGDNVVFDTNLGTLFNPISLNGDKTVGFITFGDWINNFQVGNNTDTLNLNSGVNYNNTVGGNVNFRPANINFGANNTTWSGNGTGNFYVRANLIGSGTITKQGSHTLRLAGNNSAWTGGLILEGGNVNLSFLQGNDTNANNIFGTGSITFAGNSAVQLNRSGNEVTWTNTIINNNATASNGNSTFRFTGGTQSGGVVTVAGDVSSGGLLADTNRLIFDAKVGFNSTNFAEGRWNVSGDWSGYNPGGNQVIAVGDGTLQIDAQQSIADSAVTYAFNGTSPNLMTSNANVESGIDIQTSKLILNGAFTMANDINFANVNLTDLPAGESAQSVGSTQNTGTATLSGEINMADNNSFVNLFSQTSGTTLQVTGTIRETGSGNTLAVNNRYSYAWGTNPPGAHQVAWRNPEGIVEFTGNNTYSANTVVEAGTLLVNNVAGSGTGTGDVTVESGATLGGSGTIGTGTDTDVTISGILSPGNSPGTLSMDLGSGTLNISASEDLIFELGSTSDQVLLTSGTLAIGSGVIGFDDFSFSDTGDLTAGVYTLFDTSNTISGSLDGTNLSGSIGSLSGTLSLENGSQDVVLTVIPEPSSLLLALISGLTGWVLIRRR